MGKVYRWFGLGKRLIAALMTVVVLLTIVPYADRVSSAESTDYDLPWLWPVPGSYKLNSLDYYYGGGLHNQGQCIDIGANGYTGSNRLDVVSATSGTVHYIQNKYNETNNRGSGWGNYVIVRSGNINIVYGHLKTITCDYGEIKAGDVIGKMGNTGNSTGVHLHVQAYPVGSGSSSTAIHVFDQYFTNPLYVERFQFMKGLKTYSKRYGEWIAAHYTNTSGLYYTYSGGLESDFEITPVSAAVKVVNSSGASVRSLPLADNAYNVDTFAKGTIVKVIGSYTDAYGELWLLVSNTEEGKTWLYAGDVGFYEHRSSVTLSNAVLPHGSYDSFYELPFAGDLHSVNVMESMTLTLQSEGETVASVVKVIGDTSFRMEGLLHDSHLLDSLEGGSYTLVISVAETATYPGADAERFEAVLATSEFSVNDTVTDDVAPFIEAISVVYVSSEAVTLRVSATDNVKLDKVSVVFTDSANGETKTFLAEETDNGYLLEVDVSELMGAGEYTAEAIAVDAFGNTSSSIRVLEIPENSLFESWIVVEGPLNVRAEPNTSSKRIKKLSTGDVIAVTEIIVGDKYIWGKSTDGWSALNYCRYQNGALYEIRLDLNGGSSDMPSTLYKNFGSEILLPDETPVRMGCAFLGWAVSSDATSAEYHAGDVYSADESITLFAVWSDTESPVIRDVTVTPDGWTNGAATVKVNASDNGGILYYSFDGGKSWRKDGTLILTQNRRIAERNIMVKDAFGNTTCYETAVSIDRIDTVPPNVLDANVDLTVGETGITFSCDGITDAQSGIARYELVLAFREDFSDAQTMPVTSGQKIPLTSGIYYAKLKVYDGAGNVENIVLNRFLVGDSFQLKQPTDIRVVKTSAAGTELSWTSVTNADTYVVSLGLNKNFSDAIEITVDKTTATITNLANAKYYCRIMAKSNINEIAPSEWSSSISFNTRSEDNAIYDVPHIVGAVVDNEKNTVTGTTSYLTEMLNLTVTVDPTATVTYWSDENCQHAIKKESIAAYPFTESTLTLYILVTAENGNERLYTVNVTRDSVDIIPDGELEMVVEGNYLLIHDHYFTADRIISGLVIQDGVSVYSVDGVLLNDDEQYVGSGCTIVLEGAAGVLRSLTILISGDMDGDGIVTIHDATTIHKLSNGMWISEHEWDLAAGDMDKDGKLSAADAYLAHLLV